MGSLGEGGYAEVYQVRDTLTVEAPQVRHFYLAEYDVILP